MLQESMTKEIVTKITDLTQEEIEQLGFRFWCINLLSNRGFWQKKAWLAGNTKKSLDKTVVFNKGVLN